jgi:hypothetical protein
VAQKRGTKILKVPNPPDALKASNGEKSVQKEGFMLLRLLAPEPENHRLKNLQSLDFPKPELVICRLTSFKQLLCRIKEKIHH